MVTQESGQSSQENKEIQGYVRMSGIRSLTAGSKSASVPPAVRSWKSRVAVYSVREERAFGRSIICYSPASRRSRGSKSDVPMEGRGEAPFAERLDGNIEVGTGDGRGLKRRRMDERPEIVLTLTGSRAGEVALISLGARRRVMAHGRRAGSLRSPCPQPAARSRINRPGREEGCPGSTCPGTLNSVFLTALQNNCGHRPSTV